MGVSRIMTGEDGDPQGVSIVREATDLKPSRREIPVPPMIARTTGAKDVGLVNGGAS